MLGLQQRISLLESVLCVVLLCWFCFNSVRASSGGGSETLVLTKRTVNSTASTPTSSPAPVTPKVVFPAHKLTPAKVFVPVPTQFVAESIVKNKTVYLSWYRIKPENNTSYQIYMAYGNHQSQSKYKHIESTFQNEERFKLKQLLKQVDGNVSRYTFMKFKVRASVGGKQFSKFTEEGMVNLHDLVSGDRAHRISPSMTRIPVPEHNIWKYVLPVMCLVLGALLTAFGFYAYKQVLYKRRYRQYMRTHYETDSEAVSVSNENYNEYDNEDDHQLRFSEGIDTRDDEHLVIA